MAEISHSAGQWAAVIGLAAWAAVACSPEPTLPRIHRADERPTTVGSGTDGTDTGVGASSAPEVPLPPIGGAYRPGNGVTTPVPLNEVKPRYTSAAMRARIQGQVWVECVVQLTGVCTDVHVVRSLDTAFGLDSEAVKAAEKWRFRPGMRLGQPVPVLVTIELSFTLSQ